MKRRQLAFFKDSLGRFFNSAFLLGEIDSTACERLKSWCKTPAAKGYAQRLFSEKVVEIPLHRLRLRLKPLREMDGARFDHIEGFFTGKKRHPKRICFVGHRFVPRVEETLRWNLRQVLEPYNVKLVWSGRDIRSVQILDDILRRMKTADSCVFDNQATRGKCNVYIEAGMCIVLRKPFIFFDYEPVSPDRYSPGTIPSDLSFALTLRYRNYKQLFRDFYSRLPVFFEENLR